MAGSWPVLIWPTLEIGETGLWLLQNRDEKVVSTIGSRFGVWWPVRSNHNERFPQVLAMAEALEVVWNAPKEQQFDLVKQYAHSKIPEISRCAVEVLAEAEPEELRKLSGELASNSGTDETG